MKNDDIRLANMWNQAFKALEVAFDGDDIKKNLKKVMELVALFTISDDIQIFKYDKNKGNIEKYIMLDDDKESMFKECEKYFNYGIIDNYRINKKNDKNSIVEVETKNNRYAIALSNNDFIDEDINHIYLEIVKRIFKVIFEKEESENEIKRIYRTDSLTQIGNRAYYTEITDKLFSDGPKEITYSLIDLFRLKYINDNFGHLYGDKYIKTSADMIREELDDNDKLFRIGGDEFVVLSGRMSKDKMIQKFKNANLKLNRETFGLKLEFPLTINYGVVEDCDVLDGFYQKADKELTENKNEVYKRLKLDRRR